MSDLGRDCGALDRRLETHQRYSAREINDWIFAIARPSAEESVLDLGCGSGKQLLEAAARVGGAGAVVGLDVSAEALRAVEAGLAARRPAAPVRLVESAIEDLDAALPARERFDLVLACFSLYYVASPEVALAAIRRRVLPGGRVFVCGPGPGNNREFLALCDAVVPRSEQAQRRDETLVFMEAALPKLAAAHFASVREHSFENPVVFPDVPSVLAYWRSYHLYSPAYEGAFQGAVEAHVARHGSFSTVKRVRGALLA